MLVKKIIGMAVLVACLSVIVDMFMDEVHLEKQFFVFQDVF